MAKFETADEAREFLKATEFDAFQAVKAWCAATEAVIEGAEVNENGDIYYEDQNGGRRMDEDNLLFFANWLERELRSR